MTEPATDQLPETHAPEGPPGINPFPQDTHPRGRTNPQLVWGKRFHLSPTLATVLSALVVVTTLITGLSALRGSMALARERTSLRVSEIARLLAAHIDADALASIRREDQQNSPTYRRIHAVLVQLPTREGRGLVQGIRDVYIVRRRQGPRLDDYSRYTMVVDGTPTTDPEFLPTGRIMRTSNSTDALNRVWEAGYFVADRHYVTDQRGTWLSGFIPLRRQDGSYEAVLGIDVDAGSVSREGYWILAHLLGGFGFSLLVILPAVAWFGRRLARPFRQIDRRHQALSRLDFSGAGEGAPIEAQWIQEIHAISESLQRMQGGLEAFGRYVPIDLVRKLVVDQETICLDGETRELAIMFSDIVGFTSLSEHLPAKTTLALLNQYFTIFQAVARETNGTLDKYIGDAALVFWGAPEAIPNPALQCVEAALLCQEGLKHLNEQWRRDGGPVVFETCFGLDYGEVVVGNMGSADRVNYTIVGDRVNLCSRLEHQNRVYGTRILVTRALLDALGPLKDDYTTVKVDVCQLRGFHQPVEVYELRGRRAEATDEERSFVSTLQTVWIHRSESRHREAFELLDQLLPVYREIPYVKLLRDHMGREQVSAGLESA